MLGSRESSAYPDGGILFGAEPPEFYPILKPEKFVQRGLKGTSRYWKFEHEPNYATWTNTPYITVGLVARGYSDDDIQKIIGGNFVRVAGAILKTTPKDHLG